MRYRYLFYILLFLGYELKGQNWALLGSGLDNSARCLYTDTVDNNLYIGGKFRIAGGDTIPGIAKWDGSQYIPMGCGFDWDCNSTLWGYPGPLLAIVRYKGDIYSGGYFSKADNKPIKNIARWNGFTWDSAGTSFNNDGNVSTLKVINDELYIGGVFTIIGGISVNSLAKWNGTTWSDVFNFPVLNQPNVNFVNAIEYYKGELYIGGNFQGDSGRQDICKWNGQNWVSVGGGLYGNWANVGAMAIYKNELYVAGDFFKSDGNAGENIMKWNGSAWSDVGGGTAGSGGFGQVRDMVIYNDELYIVGTFDYAGGVPAQYIAKWNGSKWCSLSGLFDNVISSLSFLNDTLYIGGGFWTIDGDSLNYIAKWIGGSYVDTCGAITGTNPEIANPSKINIFPNPSSGNIAITLNEQFSFGEICIYNALGKKVFNRFIDSNQTVEISSLPPGIYLVQLSNEQESHTEKIIISK